MQESGTLLKYDPHIPVQEIPKKIKLEAKNITHVYQSTKGVGTKAIDNVSLSIHDQEIVALIGPSGCGKTTFLNVMAGLVTPTSGEIFMDGSLINGINSKVGYMSQLDSLLPWNTVIDNVALGLELKGVPKKTRREVAGELINKAGLSGFENSYPYELSGGMRKRVTIIRTLAVDPEIIFMDEPFGPLDAFTRELLQEEILRIWQETKKTIVYVTHDLAEAIVLADRVVLMTARPAKIKAEYKMTLPRLKTVMEVKFERDFVEMEKIIWNNLRNEIIKSNGSHGGGHEKHI